MRVNQECGALGRRQRKYGACLAVIPLLLLVVAGLAKPDVSSAGKPGPMGMPNPLLLPDASGAIQTYTTNRTLDFTGAFFQELGTNGRTCYTCHQPEDGWGLSVASVRQRFLESQGLEPLFRTNDGSNSPLADVSTLEARYRAYSMLLNRAVIRVELSVPPDAEFEVVHVDDPYGYANPQRLSLFRRPLQSTNLGFLSAVMWDGRETIVPIDSTATSGRSTRALQEDLAHQAIDATLGHAQALAPPTPGQLRDIVNFELGLFTAQIYDNGVGWLTNRGGRGGAMNLSQQPFYIGINDPLGGNPTGMPFDPRAMTLYNAWTLPCATPAEQAVARGQELFNTFPIPIRGVGGINDTLGVPVIMGTCTTCHDTPNVGNHSVVLPINIGLADASIRTPDLPLYTLRNKYTGALTYTTDPGRALITGKWKDIGKFKGPILRGLAARAPYFHNGAAATLEDVIQFFEKRFGIRFTPRQESDLIAFLRCL